MLLGENRVMVVGVMGVCDDVWCRFCVETVLRVSDKGGLHAGDCNVNSADSPGPDGDPRDEAFSSSLGSPFEKGA